jgi:hypothetical protein
MIMEWFADDPNRGCVALMVLALVVTGFIIWFGRRKLAAAIPIALIFLLLAVISIPGIVPARSAAQRAVCVINLKMIAAAKTEWARQLNKTVGDVPTETELNPYANTNLNWTHPLTCPRGGTYTIGEVGENPTCSFSKKGHKLESGPGTR